MVNGYIIADVTDFRKHFDLEQMLPLAWQISIAQEMFAGEEECEEAQDALHEVLNGGTLNITTEGDCARWEIDGYEGEVKFSALSLPETLEGQEAARLLICQLGGREYVPSTESGQTKPPQSGPLHSGETLEYELADESTLGELKVQSIKNESLSGESLLSLHYKGEEVKVIRVPHGDTLNLLLKGSKVAGIIPPVSTNNLKAISSNVNTEGKATVYSLDFESGRTVSVASFKCRNFCQVCADIASGFVALIDNQIYIQSRIVPADAEDDMYIPTDETVVMIGVSASQIMALTDKGRVYSNFESQNTQKEGVLRITKLASGALVAETTPYQAQETPFSTTFGKDTYTFVGNGFVKE